MRAGPPHVVVQQVGDGGRYVPALAEVAGDAVVAVLCDGFGAWDEGELGAGLMAPRLLARVVARPGQPLLDGVLAGLHACGPEVGGGLTRDPMLEGAGFGVLVARVSGRSAEIASIGAMAATRIGSDGSVARTSRQTLAEELVAAGRAPLPAHLTHIWTSGVQLQPDGRVHAGKPLATAWTLDDGDTVLLASTRLAERLAGADDRSVRQVVAVNLRQDAVAALPPLERDEHRWSERQYSAIVVRV